MSASTAPARKKNVVVVGGGVIGSIFTHKLSAQLDPSKNTLTLIESRPYAIWLIAGCRLTVTDQGSLEDSCFVPCDNIFVNGNGKLKQGMAVALEIKTDAEKDSDESDAVVLDNGERVPFDVLVLATGCKYSGPVAFPDTTESIDHVKEWRNKFKDANDICLVGGGGVAVELAGELRDIYPTKKITIVHGQNLLLKEGQFPDKFREYVGARLQARGIDLILGEYVASFPESDKGEVVLRSGKKFSADLLVPTYGPRPHTEFIASSLGSKALSPTGYVKIRPTLQLESYPSVFAIGDIIDYPEGKRATKGNGHISVVIGNVMSYLKDPSRPLQKEYKGSLEAVIFTNGKNGGMGYFPILWGIIIGDWMVRKISSEVLHADAFRRMLGVE